MGKTYEIGEIFYLDEEYASRAQFCNDNNLSIVELERDEKGRRFKITDQFELPKEQKLFADIWTKKQQLEKFKEDVEQVELFGMERTDYAEKKEACRQLILELRELEKNLIK